MFFKISKKIFIHKSFVFLPLAVIFHGNTDFYITMLLSAVLHEAAHALTAHLAGESPERFYISPYGCELRLACAAPRREAAIVLSGPLFSLFLALFAFFLGFTDLFRANALLFSLNMLPAYPLDGGKLLKIALWHLAGVYRGNKILKRVSFAAAICLFIAAVPFKSVWFAIIAVLIVRRANGLRATPFYRKRKRFAPVKAFRVGGTITVLEALRLFSPYYYTCIFVESRSIFLTERDIIAIAQEGDYAKEL